MTGDQRWHALYERFTARDVDAVLAEYRRVIGRPGG
jgi:hypothetical protein